MKKHFVTASALAFACFVIVHASTAQSAEKAPAKKAQSQDLMKVSKDGYGAVRAIHLARIAIFNGDTKLASEMLATAQTDLDAATKDVHTFPAHTKAADQAKTGHDKSASEKMDLIPIDGGLAIADTFVPSPEKKGHIEKANEHLKSGHSKEAIEELQLGEIDVVYTCAMLPLKATEKRLVDAEKLVSEHKYYEANLALKAAEEGIVYESVDLTGTPVPASTASAATPTKK
jgi:hypothetical protein